MKKRIFSIVTIVFCLIVRLWVGVYNHDEFAETHLFIKHRPLWKWTSYSLIGMSDLSYDDLDENQKQEQLLFEEFVSSKGMSK